VDAAWRCRAFIRELSAAPTEYPVSTREHFRRLRGDVDPDHIDEWIDVHLIADLTEKVYGLLWFPSIVFVLLLAGRNQWTDAWPTSYPLLFILMLNFLLALSSVIILQKAAVKAKRAAEDSLDAKLKNARAAAAVSKAANESDQLEKLLEEIRALRRGAFVRLRDNPILGALLMPSFGLVLIQLLTWLGSR
jgi:hypothetical protein